MPRKSSEDSLLLLNGELPSPDLARKIARDVGLILCADGGTRHAVELGLEPSIIIGDMDSLPKKLPPWKKTTFLCDFDPDTSDFEKALRFISGRWFRRAGKRLLKSAPKDRARLWIAGALGGRLDHAMVNLALAERYAGRIPIGIVDRGLAWILSKGAHRIDCKKGQTLTLLSLSALSRVTTRGLLFPLRGEILKRGSRGLSNRATSSQTSLRIHSGVVWVFLS